jgi:hypothetical protein
MIDNYGWLGKWYIKAINVQTKEIIKEEEIKNTIMEKALNELAKPLYGENANIYPSYLALGTSSVSVQTTQTQLQSEIFRTAYATRVTSSNNETITNYIVLDSEANEIINEIGIFGGSSASLTTNSGTMISRILWNYDKTSSNIELQFTRTDKIQRA